MPLFTIYDEIFLKSFWETSKFRSLYVMLQARVDFTNLHENYFFFKDNICWQYLAGKNPRVIIVLKTHTTCTCINKPRVRTLEISKADKLMLPKDNICLPYLAQD